MQGLTGLGRRFAALLAANGARVVATARRVDRLEELADEIRSAGGSCLPLALDVNGNAGFSAFTIDSSAAGSAGAGFADSFIFFMNGAIDSTLLDDAAELRLAGNEFFKAGKVQSALDLYRKSLLCVASLGKKSYADLQPHIQTLIKLRLTTMSNLTQCFLKTDPPQHQKAVTIASVSFGG